MGKLKKYIHTRIRCWQKHIPYESQLIIAPNVYLSGGRRMVLGAKTTLERYSMLVAHDGGHIHIDEGSNVSRFSRIGAHGSIYIGKYVLMGPNVFIADYNHGFEDIATPIVLQPDVFIQPTNREHTIFIGDGSWLGTNVVIVGNVHIGKHCVIGAGSIVTKDIPDYSVVVGNPCRIIKKYDETTNQWLRITESQME